MFLFVLQVGKCQSIWLLLRDHFLPCVISGILVFGVEGNQREERRGKVSGARNRKRDGSQVILSLKVGCMLCKHLILKLPGQF